jgi:hypothetical protein
MAGKEIVCDMTIVRIREPCIPIFVKYIAYIEKIYVRMGKLIGQPFFERFAVFMSEALIII